ncbi:MAG: Ig-like domain-containing protein [Verrucomicrobiota bacterium]
MTSSHRQALAALFLSFHCLPVALFAQAPGITATKTDNTAAATKKNPGETVTYTNVISNAAGAGAATGLRFTDPDVAGGNVVAGTLRVSPIAFDDVYTATIAANTTIDTNASSEFSVTANDYRGMSAGAAATLSITAFDATSANGGTVTMVASGPDMGKFTYTPAANFVGSDSFTYTVTNSGSLGNTGTVSLTVSGPVVWYVNAATGSDTTGKGTLSQPFATVNKAATVDAANQKIFVVSGSYTGTGVTLESGESLIGQGSGGGTFDAFVLGFTPSSDTPARPILGGSRPTLSGGTVISLAAGNTIRGVDLSSTAAGNALSGSNIATATVGGLPVDTSVTSSNTASTGINLNGGTGNITINATINATAGTPLSIANRAGGIVTLNGKVSSSGGDANALSLAGNGATTINLHSVGLSTTSNTAFSATGSGTLTLVNGAGDSIDNDGDGSTDEADESNTLATTTGTALNLNGVTVGAGHLTFQSINSNGGSAAGILIRNTSGSSGTVFVTGTGTAGSGGTIQNKTGSDVSSGGLRTPNGTTDGTGVYLAGAGSLSLDRMNLQGFSNFAIYANGATGFKIDHSTLGGTNGDNAAQDEGGLRFLELRGSCSLLNSTFGGNSITHVVRVVNTSGTVGLTVNGSTFTNPAAASGDDGLFFEAGGTATITANVFGNAFTANRGDHFQAASLNSGNLNISFKGNTLTGGHATALGAGVTINAATGVPGYAGTVNYDIDGNTFNGAVSNAITVNLGTSGPAALFNGFIRNNTIGTAGSAKSGSLTANGIGIDAHGNGTHTCSVTGNTVIEAFDRGISVLVNDGTSGVLNLTVQGNDLDQSVSGDALGSRESFFLNNGSTSTNVFGQIDGATLRLNFGGAGALANLLDHGVSSTDDFRVRQRFQSRIEMPGYGGTPFDNAAVVAYLSGRNTLSAGATASATSQNDAGSVNDGYFVASSVPLPGATPLPLLFAENPPASSNVTPPAPAAAGVSSESASAATPRAAHAAPENLLESEQLDSLVAEAIHRWEATGLTKEQSQVLRRLRFEISDLQTLHLGQASGDRIQISRQAAGNGWFIDATPADDAEFPRNGSGSRHTAAAGEAALGRVDLLTTLMHEMGHSLGLCDSYSNLQQDSVMYGFLGRGERRLPVDGQAAGATPHEHGEPHFLAAPIDIGVLPPGKSVTIIYDVTIANPLTTFPLSSQGTVSGSNFADKLTDDLPGAGDPALPGAADPTVTQIERPDTTVASINRSSASPTNGSSVNWQIVFANPLAGLTAGNFTLATTGLGGTPSITGVTAAGGAPATTWNITATTGTGDGTLGLNLVNDGALTYDVTNKPFTGQLHTLDRSGPNAIIVLADSALKRGETSLVTITFNEAATGFTNDDLTVENGTLSPVSTSDSLTWTATLTPGTSVTDASNLITLDKTGVTDSLGNSGTGTAASSNYEIDTASATAGIVVADTALKKGETSLVTFTFSEPVTGLTAVDLTVENGVVGSPTTLDGISWTATLTPTDGLADASNVITLDNTGVNDLAGNPGTGTTNSNSYGIDTLRPSATLVVTDSALLAGETSLVTITFTEAVTGFSNADLNVENGVLSPVSSSDGDVTWTATLTPTDGIADAANVIALDNTGVNDLADNPGTGTTNSNSYGIETTRPTASLVVADTALRAGETSLLTITFSEPVSGFANDDLTLENGTLSVVSSGDGGITWTATFTPASNITDPTNLITLDNTGMLDASGNTGTDTTNSNNYAIDTARPTATIVVTDDNLMIGETSLVTITFSEAVSGFGNEDLALENGTLSIVSSGDGGITWTATFTPTSNVTDPTNLITLTNTGVLDNAGNTGTGTTVSNNYAVTSLSISIAAVSADAAEGTGTGNTAFTFTVSRTGSTTGDVTVDYAVTGAADAADFGGSLPSGSFVIPDAQTSAVLTINVSKDSTVEPDESFTVTIGNASGGYAIGTATASSAITNDDTAAYTVVQSGGSTAVTEPATTDSFTVVLNARPLTDVVVGISGSDTTESTVSAAALTFTPANWNVAQTVTVTAADDLLVDGLQNSTITVSINDAASNDAFDLLADQSVSVTTADNDVAGFTLVQSGGSTAVSEPATTDSFTVVLNAQPLTDVVLGVSSSDTTEATVSAASLTFTTANWNVAQTVTVSAVDDVLVDGVRNSTITVSVTDAVSDHAFDALVDQTITASTADNDAAGFTIVQSGGSTGVAEPATTDSFSVVLTAQPLSDVVLAVSGSDATEATVSASSLTFTSLNWNVAQTVTVTAADDLLVDGTLTSTVTVAVNDASSDNAFDPVADQTVSVTTADNDLASILIAQTGGSTEVAEPGTTDSFTVTLGAQPLTDVVLNVSSGDTSEATVSPGSVTFTTLNWNVAQVVTVSAADDVLVDGTVAGSVTVSVNDAASDDAFDALADQTVAVATADNDVSGFAIVQSGGTTAVSEPNTTDTFTVVLTAQPLGPVTFTVSSSDTTESTVSSGSLTFTNANWNVAQTVTVSAADDFLVDGGIASTVTVSVNDAASDNAFDGLADQTVSVSTADDDVPGFAIVQSGGITAVTEPSTTDTFTVVLTAQPLTPVTFAVSGSDTTASTVSPAALTFTNANWNVAQTVTVTAVDDTHMDAPQTSVITVTVNDAASDNAFDSLADQTVAVTTADNDVLTLSVTAPDAAADENSAATGTWRVSRNTIIGTTTVQLRIDAASTATAGDAVQSGASFASVAPGGTGTISIPEGQTSAEITLTPSADIHAEADETLTLNIAADAAYTVGPPSAATITIGKNDFVVISTGASGEGTLRQAVLNSNDLAGSETITFEGAVFTDATVPDIIDLDNMLPSFAGQTMIQGLGAARLIVRRPAAAASFGLMQLFPATEVTLRGLTLSGGSGGIANLGTLKVENCVLTGNSGSIYGGILNNGTLTVSNSTLSGNASAGVGGGIYNLGNRTLTVVNSTLTGNTSNNGGGAISIVSGSTVTISNSTISANSADSSGGGVLNSGTLTVIHSTITGNTSTGQGGGIATSIGGSLTLANSIVAGNTASSGPDINTYSAGNLISSNGANFIGSTTGAAGASPTDLSFASTSTTLAGLLGPLGDNGGVTLTHALVNGSPAINGGNNANIPLDTLDLDGDSNTTEPLPYDQRGSGFVRVIGTTVDMGSYEAFAFEPTVTSAVTDEDVKSTAGLVITANTADGGLTTHYKITGILSGTLYQNDGITVITEGGFITKAQGAAGLKFLPAANLNGVNTAGFGFTAQAAVSTVDADLRGTAQVVSITVNPVNDAPTVVAPGLADQIMTIGQNLAVALPPKFADLDGDTLGFIVQSNNNSTKAGASISGTTLNLSALASGVATIAVRADDGQGGTVSDSFTVSVGTANATAVQPVTTNIPVNSQTGLFDVIVNVTNTTPLPINGFRLHVNFNAYKAAHPSLRLYNASSAPNASDVYVDYPYPVAVNGVVPVKLSFYTSTRRFPSPFKPVLTVETLATSQVSDNNGKGVQPRLVRLADKSVLLEFPSVAGKWYRVRYSADLVHWFDSPVPLQAGSNRMQWIDSGAPFTNVPPAQAGSRFYLVNEIEAP